MRLRMNAALAMLSGLTPLLAQDEIQMLKERVAELERQNRAILETLAKQQATTASPTVATSDLTNPGGSPATPTVPVSATVRAAPAPPPQQLAAERSRAESIPAASAPASPLKFYGLLRLDLDVDSARPNNGQIPFFIPPDDGVDHGSFSMHPRLTRFGVDVNGPRIASLGDAAITGKLELDFENGGSESRQIIRIRHAYFRTAWKSVSVLAGQTWDIVSPLFPTINNDALMWNAGNPGDRRPQLRLGWEPKTSYGTWSVVTGMGLMGAVDLSDLDNNGYRDGEESGRPNLQARVGFSRPIIGDLSASVGFSGFYGWLNTSKPVSGRTAWRSQLLNVDYTLPFTRTLSLRGEGWWGRNLSDIRAGAGQGINMVSGREIRARGGWSELSWRVSKYWSLHPGWTLDKPVSADIADGGRTRNGAFYIGNRIMPNSSLTIGADYLRWLTDHKGLRTGIDHRVNMFFQYAF